MFGTSLVVVTTTSFAINSFLFMFFIMCYHPQTLLINKVHKMPKTSKPPSLHPHKQPDSASSTLLAQHKAAIIWHSLVAFYCPRLKQCGIAQVVRHHDGGVQGREVQGSYGHIIIAKRIRVNERKKNEKVGGNLSYSSSPSFQD